MAFTDLAAGFAPQSVQTLDLQYQAMVGVQNTWGFPQLPDEVTVDLLAEPSLETPESQEEFLYGLANDLEEATRPKIDIPQLEIARTIPAVEGPAARVPGKFQAEDAFVQEIRSKFASIAGVRAPEIIVSDPDHAVLDLKRKAIEGGYLPEDTPLDGSWSPGLNRVRRNVLDDEFKKTLKGEEFASISSSQVLEQLDRWASPGSLLMTAAGLDMLPNLGKIGEEFENWGDNIKSWIDDPFDLGKFGKALGPVDDLLFPAVNAYLTFTGFRSLLVFGRALRGVSSSGAGVFGMRGLAPGAGAQVPELMRFSAQGRISKSLADRQSGFLQRRGKQMQDWRRTSNVLMTKKAVQQGMKVGFVGEIENELSPQRTGYSILGQGGTVEDRVQQFKDFRTVTPIGMAVSTALDIPFAPTSMLAPGAVTGKVKRMGKPLAQRLIGLDKDKTLSVAVTTTLLDGLADLPGYEDRVDTARKLIKQNKVEDASAVLLTGEKVVDDGVREKSGMIKMFLVGSVALHKAATEAAKAAGHTAGTAKYKRTYHAMRNHFISRLRPFDFDEIDMDDPEQIRFFVDVHSGVLGADVEIDEAGRFLAGQKPAKRVGADGRKEHRERLSQMIADGEIDKEWIDDSIAHHMDLRNGTYNDLLDGVNEADIAVYLQDVFETLDNWDSWTGSNQFLHEWAAEADSVLQYIKPRGYEAKWEPSSIESQLLGKLLPKKMSDNRSFNQANPLQNNLDNGDVAVNVALLDTPTKQDVMLLARRMKHLLKLKRAAGYVPEGASRGVIDEKFRQSLLDFAETKNKSVGELKGFELEEWSDSYLSPGQKADPTAPRQIKDDLMAYGRAVRTMDQEGFKTFDEGLQFIDEQLKAIRNSDFWDKIHIDRMLIDDVGKGRMKTDDELITDLNRAREFVAGELDVPEEVKQRLAEQGYKAVAGRDFLFDGDLIGLDSPFADIVRADMKKRSLGMFFSRNENTAQQITALRRTQTASAMAREVNRAIDLGAWDGPTEGFDWAPGSEIYDNIMANLYSQRSQLQSTATAAEESAIGLTSKVGTRMRNSGLPYTVNDLRIKDVDRALNGNPDLRPPGQPPLYGPAAVKAITSALRKGKVLPFERAGLGMLQDKLVSESWLRQGLNVFRYAEAADDAGFLHNVRQGAKFVGVGRSANSSRPELDLWRHYQHLGGAMFGAALGYAQTGDPLVAAASGVAGGLEGQPSPGMFARNVARSGIFLGGAQAASAAGASDMDALAAGAAASTLGFGAMRGIMTAAGKPAAKLTKSWATYSRLGDSMIRERDRVRFALSPIFDVQRYTEGMVLSLTAQTGDVDLPITLRPMKLSQDLTGKSKAQILDEYKMAGNTEEWLDAVESGQAWFYERGLMGFSPTEWMAATHARLVHHGWESAEAADKVREIYTYGLKGRSGLEQSVNFVFFPFSFQKKYLGAVGKFMADDIGRAMVMHDTLKMLEIVSEHYDLEERYRDRMPILDQLRKVNSVAYGISPGQLGGINRPYLDLIRSSPGTATAYDNIVNIFLPQALEIKSEGDMENLKYNMRRVLPIMRDIQDLHEDIMEQGHVLTSPSFLSRREEARRGWEEYNDLRQKMNDAAQAAGISPASIYRGEGAYGAIRQYYDEEIAEIGKRFPHWQESRIQASQRAVRKSAEIRDIVRTPETPAEVAMSEFDMIVKRAEQAAGVIGGDFMYNSDLIPPQLMSYLRQRAINLAIDVPGFDTFYRMYYQDMLGPIHQRV